MSCCRFCLSSVETDSDLATITPCTCTCPVHEVCLNQWRKTSMEHAIRCEVCQTAYRLSLNVKKLYWLRAKYFMYFMTVHVIIPGWVGGALFLLTFKLSVYSLEPFLKVFFLFIGLFFGVREMVDSGIHIILMAVITSLTVIWLFYQKSIPKTDVTIQEFQHRLQRGETSDTVLFGLYVFTSLRGWMGILEEPYKRLSEAYSFGTCLHVPEWFIQSSRIHNFKKNV